jgi:hypothetical protein
MSKGQEQSVVATKVAGNLSLNGEKVGKVVGFVFRKRIRDLLKVTRLRLSQLKDEHRTSFHGPQQSDDLQIQVLWQWQELLDETKGIADAGERIKAKTQILANLTSLVNSIQSLAGEIFHDGMELLSHEVRAKELAAKLGHLDGDDITDAELVKMVDDKGDKERKG